MLKKKERLNRDAFNRFFSVGKRDHSPYFTLIYSSSQSLHASVVVPKKVESRAVRRNKLRRQVYDIVRNDRKVRGTKGVFIILLKQRAVGAPYEELKHELLTHITRLQTKL